MVQTALWGAKLLALEAFSPNQSPWERKTESTWNISGPYEHTSLGFTNVVRIRKRKSEREWLEIGGKIGTSVVGKISQSQNVSKAGADKATMDRQGTIERKGMA